MWDLLKLRTVCRCPFRSSNSYRCQETACLKVDLRSIYSPQIPHVASLSEEYFIKRLQGIFKGVATNPLILRNSKNVPLYLLCFAAGNQRGAPTAVKIAKEILEGMQNSPQLTLLD